MSEIYFSIYNSDGAVSSTTRDPLETAKDTVNWFAGKELFEMGITINNTSEDRAD